MEPKSQIKFNSNHIDLEKNSFTVEEISIMLKNPNYTVFTSVLEDKNDEETSKQIMIFVTKDYLKIFFMDKVKVLIKNKIRKYQKKTHLILIFMRRLIF